MLLFFKIVRNSKGSDCRMAWLAVLNQITLNSINFLVLHVNSFEKADMHFVLVFCHKTEWLIDAFKYNVCIYKIQRFAKLKHKNKKFKKRNRH